MLPDNWQKSSYCGEGESCIHVARAADRTVKLTESADPSRGIVTLAPDAFAELLRTIRAGGGGDVAYGPGDVVRLQGGDADVVTTTREKWDAFVLGVRAGEFDHLVAEG
ncbi:DUF397 domain-containing protein [Streptomyces sp. NPDC000410]|uniref:DUF397 domain-containing protein n=1 Tax=Streptomyces sp. NPDC000410 TaxID=3154254 RepID=UPI00332C340C